MIIYSKEHYLQRKTLGKINLQMYRLNNNNAILADKNDKQMNNDCMT